VASRISLPRITAAAIATVALTASVAAAQPVDGPIERMYVPIKAVERSDPYEAKDLRTPDAADSSRGGTPASQDLRTPDAVDPSRGAPSAPQDLRTPDAVDPSRASTPFVKGGQAPAQAPQADEPVASSGGDGTDWTVPGLALAGAGALLAGLGVMRIRLRPHTDG